MGSGEVGGTMTASVSCNAVGAFGSWYPATLCSGADMPQAPTSSGSQNWRWGQHPRTPSPGPYTIDLISSSLFIIWRSYNSSSSHVSLSACFLICRKLKPCIDKFLLYVSTIVFSRVRHVAAHDCVIMLLPRHDSMTCYSMCSRLCPPQGDRRQACLPTAPPLRTRPPSTKECVRQKHVFPPVRKRIIFGSGFISASQIKGCDICISISICMCMCICVCTCVCIRMCVEGG